MDPQELRFKSQEAEDEFCKRLLHLGAKWWDSRDRYGFICSVLDLLPMAFDALENDREPWPTMYERRWISVAWPSTGGLWVGEFDTTMFEPVEDDNIVPFERARLLLARTMDEKARILREHFNAKFFERVEEYEGYGFLNSWETKTTGERGPLQPVSAL
jgi:hypothetical protein